MIRKIFENGFKKNAKNQSNLRFICPRFIIISTTLLRTPKNIKQIPAKTFAT